MKIVENHWNWSRRRRIKVKRSISTHPARWIMPLIASVISSRESLHSTFHQQSQVQCDSTKASQQSFLWATEKLKVWDQSKFFLWSFGAFVFGFPHSNSRFVFLDNSFSMSWSENFKTLKHFCTELTFSRLKMFFSLISPPQFCIKWKCKPSGIAVRVCREIMKTQKVTNAIAITHCLLNVDVRVGEFRRT